jgi:hypothetical protein
MIEKQKSHLDALSRKHRELDRKIKELQESESVDDLEISRLKQERLRVKDEIFSFKKNLAKETLTVKE